MMDLRIIDPSKHPDWDAGLLSRGGTSFFHTSAWALVLERAYGFMPLYLATVENGRIRPLMPLMEVASVLTGKRGVALPFSDQCPPLADVPEDLQAAMRWALEYGQKNGWRYIEWRDSGYYPEGQTAWKSYLTHEIDLGAAEPVLFARLGPGHQRNIKKAVREGVTVTIDRSMESLRIFYRLQIITRRRHGLPPQPFVFFRNVFKYILAQGGGVIASASHGGRVIAAAVFFHFGPKAVFKYGASDPRHPSLRANHLVMWEALRWYRREGLRTLSLGRTEVENLGLIRYKRAWGAKENDLRYYRYDLRNQALVPGLPGGPPPFGSLLSRTPSAALRVVGRLLYRHVG